MKKEIIEIKNINFSNVWINFAISFFKNTFTIISGPNNCGKTTLIRILEEKIRKELDSFSTIKTIIPEEIIFTTNSVKEEIELYLEGTNNTAEAKNKEYKNIIKKWKLTKVEKEDPKQLDTKNKIRMQLALAIIKKPSILLLDCITTPFSREEKIEILKEIKKYQIEEKSTVIMTTHILEDSLIGDALYIIKNNEIILQGSPLEVLEKDNIINKAGLNLPFMIDLSVKLKDYNLLQETELDMNKMVELLWK